ncbi:MAG: NAD-dependent epimerase/dehydratase family protein, partial [Patescibacteria group bacterium]|nr:NAD-dependent epimerase/dehydratase family protein [Patescibacteria group bacterium]
MWEDRNVLVTGGASFIGSHLVDKLVELKAKVTVVDDLSSGKLDNLTKSKDKIKFIKKDLEYCTKEDMKSIFSGKDNVFHLAAVHGGRGFIHTHPADVCSNLSIDHHVFEACTNNGVENITFASTACVYPTNLQAKIGSDYKLRESDTDTTNLDGYMSADIEYGWGKLMSEIQLHAFIKQYGLKGCPVRFVTAYGPRENESHAIIALIYKAVERMDPYEIWGDGQQERDFTYVEDIAEGTIKAAEKINDGTPINLGTGRRYKIIVVVDKICEILGWEPSKFKFEASKPVGALSRALDNSKAKELIGWQPRFTLEDGLRRTIEWYVKTHEIQGQVKENLLLER